jgi:hypothetical protein
MRRIVPRVLGLFALLLIASLGAVAQGTAYVYGVQDLPLMPGLTEVADAGVVFDTPTGRIVEAYARGRVSARAVRAFYAETLPQLGWKRTALNEFEREGERLRLEFTVRNNALTVSFRLAPY